ncbi:syntaxin-like protein [Perkinsela sp. CCAP 1560/4]|nr:syntaxin-like protein [Perkinsela sp. CCAP 1560/4]|eukprot:KNH09492.1 syntaxin-like protein [Perkinsela sp. CCAP 1560/4]
MNQGPYTDPWSRSYFSEFTALRLEFSYRTQALTQTTYNSRNTRCTGQHLQNNMQSQASQEKDVSKVVGQTENETVLLLFDSFSKEKYMNTLLEKFKHVEQKVEHLSQEALSPGDENALLEVESDAQKPSRSSNSFLECISQHHSKGEVISKEALKLVRQMHKKFNKTPPSSASARQIHRAIHQRWASYNSQFQETESRFKGSVSQMINEDEGLREILVHDETKETSQIKVLESYASSRSQWEHMYALEKARGKEVEDLNRDLDELNLSYQELNNLVLHQGSILDDIRHNISLGNQSMEQGVHSMAYSTKNVSLCHIM